MVAGAAAFPLLLDGRARSFSSEVGPPLVRCTQYIVEGCAAISALFVSDDEGLDYRQAQMRMVAAALQHTDASEIYVRLMKKNCFSHHHLFFTSPICRIGDSSLASDLIARRQNHVA